MPTKPPITLPPIMVTEFHCHHASHVTCVAKGVQLEDKSFPLYIWFEQQAGPIRVAFRSAPERQSAYSELWDVVTRSRGITKEPLAREDQVAVEKLRDLIAEARDREGKSQGRSRKG